MAARYFKEGDDKSSSFIFQEFNYHPSSRKRKKERKKKKQSLIESALGLSFNSPREGNDSSPFMLFNSSVEKIFNCPLYCVTFDEAFKASKK